MYEFNIIPIKTPPGFFLMQLEKLIKMQMEEYLKISQTILKKKKMNKEVGLAL